MYYSEQQILELKKQIDIKEFYKHFIGTIEEYGNEYRSICPFHDDHKPSLIIHKETGIWKCWVDGIGGDTIDFVERFYGISFRDALDLIIKEFNIKIAISEEDKKKQAIYNGLCKIHNITSNKFQNNLYRNKDAINYLKSRKIDINTIKKFKIGFIDDSSVCNNNKLLPLFLAGGLVNKRENNYYNFFSKNRISIPFQDTHGNVIGFNARTILDDKPKYLHSKTTPIFKKDEILFGFNHAKKDIAETKSVFIVEGQFDCIRAHQFGITNCVALSGTSISNKQINSLKSICKNYYIILEDKVLETIPKKGKKESPLDRIYNTIISNNSWATVKIIKLYENDKCDLDEFLLNNGKAEFLQKIKHALTYNEFVLFNRIDNIKCSTVDDKYDYIYRIKPYINSIKKMAQRERYIDILYDKLCFEELGNTEDEKEKFRQKNYSNIRKILSKTTRYDRIDMSESYDNPRVATQKIILASLFSKFKYYNSYKILEELNIENFLDEEFLNIYKEIKKIVLKNGNNCDIINILHYSDLTSEEILIADDCLFKSDTLDYLDEVYDEENKDNLFELREFLKEQIKNLE